MNIDEANAINAERLAYVGKLLDEAKTFVEQVYIPDLLAVAPYYTDWAGIGGGLSNYLCYGDLPKNGFGDPTKFKFPRGAILGRDLSKVYEVDGHDPRQVQESISHSWYKYSDGDARRGIRGKAKRSSITPARSRPTNSSTSKANTRGSRRRAGTVTRWKSGRWRACWWVTRPGARTSRRSWIPRSSQTRRAGDGACSRRSVARRRAGWKPFSSLVGRRSFTATCWRTSRTATRACSTVRKWEPATWPKKARGVGLTEAPRGALAHWIVIEDEKIANYQLVVPSTWNASPRDAKGQRSAYEASLIGTPIADPEKPLEVLRTIHSFDPCLACAVHLYDPHGKTLNRVTIGG
jgi:hydrogenase large subunit